VTTTRVAWNDADEHGAVTAHETRNGEAAEATLHVPAIAPGEPGSIPPPHLSEIENVSLGRTFRLTRQQYEYLLTKGTARLMPVTADERAVAADERAYARACIGFVAAVANGGDAERWAFEARELQERFGRKTL
jgi:hypothetical protein